MHTPPFFTNISGGKSSPASEFPGLEPHSLKSGLGLACAGKQPQLPWLGKYDGGGWELRVHAWLKETWFMEEKEKQLLSGRRGHCNSHLPPQDQEQAQLLPLSLEWSPSQQGGHTAEMRAATFPGSGTSTC